jgi:hypothetical protein
MIPWDVKVGDGTEAELILSKKILFFLRINSSLVIEG